MDSQRGPKCLAKTAPRSQPKAYCEIMNSFSGLASDLVKIPDMCEFWLGLIQSAKNIIHETPCSERQSSMLALTDNARSVMASVVDGKTTAKSASIVLEKELISEMTHELNNDKIKVLPKKRSHKSFSGGVQKNRLKSCHEKPKRKKEETCGFCGMGDHRIPRCKLRKELGTLVRDSDVDQLLADLYQRNPPRFYLLQQ